MRSGTFMRMLLCLALAAGAGAAAQRDSGQRLRTWTAPNYTVIAADGYDARRALRRIADAERVLEALLATPARAQGVPVVLWLAPRPLWRSYLAPSADITGEFVPGRFVHYLILDADLPGPVFRGGLQHEYAHLFLRTQLRTLYPLWFDEGVAQILYGAEIRRDHATLRLPANHDDGGWVPLHRLFMLDKNSREYREQPATRAVHRESWGLVHRGLVADARFGEKVFAYLDATDRLVPVETAAQESFGMSLAELDRDLYRHLLIQPQQVGRIPVRPAAPLPPVTSRLLDPAEAWEALARVMLDTGLHARQVGAVVERAEKLAPGTPGVAVLRLRVAARNRNDAELLRLADSLEASTRVVTMRGVGLGLLERVRNEGPDDLMSPEQRRALARRALVLLDRVLLSDPADAESAWGRALLTVRLREDPQPALERLAAVNQRLPDHPDLAEATARLQELRGDESATLGALVTTLRFSSTPEQRLWAARRIREIREKARSSEPQ